MTSQLNQAKQAKKQVVSEIVERIKRAESMVLVDYKGLTVAEDTELRRRMRAAGVDYKVLKNTLVRRAADECGVDGLDPMLNGSSSFAFSYDEPVAAAKVIKDFMKDNKKMSIKGGLLAGKVIDAAGVQYLADLPSKEVLIARLMGTLNAPATNLVGVLAGPARALVCALNAIREQKEQGA